MKIKSSDYSNKMNQYNDSKINQTGKTDPTKENQVKNKNELPKENQDQVEFSKNYQVQKDAVNRLMGIDAQERADKVQRLKNEIKEGTYLPDMSAVAKSITDKLV
jgi:flagellar biosynthesis anti-sigma factor FlgM